MWYKSKRFIATCVAGVLFTTLMYTTPYSPIEVATGIIMILSIYIGAETLRKS